MNNLDNKIKQNQEKLTKIQALEAKHKKRVEQEMFIRNRIKIFTEGRKKFKSILDNTSCSYKFSPIKSDQSALIGLSLHALSENDIAKIVELYDAKIKELEDQLEDL